jgi:hypothetical protein
VEIVVFILIAIWIWLSMIQEVRAARKKRGELTKERPSTPRVRPSHVPPGGPGPVDPSDGAGIPVRPLPVLPSLFAENVVEVDTDKVRAG